jgi:hypothetical protein
MRAILLERERKAKEASMVTPDRWYYFRIWERDLETASYSFVGKRIREM